MKAEPPAEIRAKEAPHAPAPPPPVEVPPPSQAGSVHPAAVAPETSTPPARPAPMGTSIRVVQNALKKLGYDPGPIDNTYGKLTRNAILKFQGAQSLPQTGVLDNDTWSAIVAKLTGD
jgi:peptidoglycan hydrolase-like protein with peptidoglycan-binding domain